MNTPQQKSRPTNPFTACVLMAILMALTSYSTHVQSQERSILQPLGDMYRSPPAAHPQLARITLYRTESGLATGATRVVINDRYQASLQPGGYTDLCMKPSVVDVGVSLQRSTESARELPDSAMFVTAKSGQEVFIRVVDLPKNRLSLVNVQPEVAFVELQKTRRQVHSISRVPGASACDQVTGSPAPKTVAITLGTDALFAYGRSDLSAILPYGREQLDRLAERLTTRYSDFEHSQIQVVGHADPVGSAASNQRLSEARATTVAAYLVRAGVSANKISSEGRGSRELVDRDCARVVSSLSMACNKVNRRVVVELTVQAHGH
jgi:OOP family OmpA-OmpF porin